MKTVVITGAGAGLGRAMARRMAGAGYYVILLGRTLSRLKDLEAELAPNARALACDVSSPDSVRTAFAEIAARKSEIDVLINNAATYEPSLATEARDDQILDPILTNLAGPIYTARSAVPMLARGGHIINISSESVAMNFPMLSLYQASKAGLERFTAALRAEVESSGIKVTLVRAGTMYDEDAKSSWEPEVHKRFAEACLKAAIDLRARPISHYKSIAGVIQAIVEAPGDVNMPQVSLEGFRA
ncbi:MAG TPA: SDR family NAD(P)-dependent oxidoreductase [Sphingobium sp.]|uniref:SDR family oxidoreductase n=1 Tax=Sphingobium sp. TaxID=1912891 RepID=UPI002ED388B8